MSRCARMLVLPLALLPLFARPTAADAPALPVYDVPRVDGLRIDGDLADWKDAGFRVQILAGADGQFAPPADLDAEFRLAWDQRGLLVGLRVRDDVFSESQDVKRLYRGDCLECFVAQTRGSREFYQCLIAPGMDVWQSTARHFFYSRGAPADQSKFSAEVARVKGKGGYTMEVLLPWKNLRSLPAPAVGQERAFQLCVDDADAPSGSDRKLVWFPREGAYQDSTAMHCIRLAKAGKPSPPVTVRASARCDLARVRTDLSALAPADRAGQEVVWLDGKRELARATLAKDATGRAIARAWIPLDPRKTAPATLQVRVAGKAAPALVLPPVGRAWADAVVHSGPAARPCVFAEDKFPEIRYDKLLWADRLLGPRQIKATFYDKDYREVAKPDNPGRYGAVVEVRPEHGKPLRRFLTLYRQPKPIQWWRQELKASVTWPSELGLPPLARLVHPRATGEFLKWEILAGANRHDGWAKLLAGLAEVRAPRPQSRKFSVGVIDDFYTNPVQLDRQWWVGLKRKLYGWDKRWPEPFVCPVAMKGEFAPAVHHGTLAQAGMKPDAAAKIDAVLSRWAADTDEAFAVCVVRRGVIVLHKAYGTRGGIGRRGQRGRRGGEAMTVTTKSWMASTTKMMSGACMMMLVDQGRLALDDSLGKYLPAFAGLKGRGGKELTIRHLYTHTSGFDGHWGDGVNDMSERLAVLVPQIDVGERFHYNGTGMELGCKILEAVTGESLPSFYRKHLLAPLGCDHTDAGSASHDGMSVPLDMCHIGQMLLNKGAYGKWRFMRPETFEQMLPRKLTKTLGPGATKVYGIGTTFFTDPGLGKGTFAHGAASSATTRIDPEHQLVISMTRNARGKNFDKYHQKFIDAIVQGMAD